jgi:hypothetical protein
VESRAVSGSVEAVEAVDAVETVHAVEDAAPIASPATDGATEPVRPAPYGGFSMRPAMLVVGLAAVIVIAFIAIGFATNGKPAQTDTSKAISVISGTPLHAVRAASALAVITRTGQPPSNILNSVSLPVGSTRVSHQFNAAEQFDAQIGLISNDSQGALRTFFLSDMKAQGWKILEVGPADHNPGAVEVVGQKAGSDGFFWNEGAVVSATTFGAGAPPAGHTHFTVRLFQVPDPD